MNRLRAWVRTLDRKEAGYVERDVDHDGGVVVQVGKTTLVITPGNGDDDVNIRAKQGALVVRPSAANAIEIREEPL